MAFLNDVKESLQKDGFVKNFKDVLLPETPINSDFQKIGLGNFTTYASINESATKSATVTQNPVEDGSVINDHIIKNPNTISISGEVANVFIENKSRPTFVQNIAPSVGIIQDYLPQRTQTQIGKINGLLQTAEDYFQAADTAIEKGTQLFDLYTGKEANKTISAQFLEFLDQVIESKSVLDVECVDKVYRDMAVTSLVVNKTNPNNYTFTISLQAITVAQTTLVSLAKKASGDARSQGAEQTDKGTQQGVTDRSFLQTAVDIYKGEQ